jgi:hypothetical protein
MRKPYTTTATDFVAFVNAQAPTLIPTVQQHGYVTVNPRRMVFVSGDDHARSAIQNLARMRGLRISKGVVEIRLTGFMPEGAAR